MSTFALTLTATKYNLIETARVPIAVIGAVDEEQVLVNGHPATRLTLSYLKPGATKEDALNLARELGLGDIILY